jgi:hypothetical protein
MAKGASVRAGGVRGDTELSEGGTLWLDIAIPSSGSVNSGQHRGRIPQADQTDKARFLNIAEGSLEECRYYLILAHDLKYTDEATMWPLSEEVGRLLNGYRCAVLRADS